MGVGHYPFTLAELHAMTVDDLEAWVEALHKMRDAEIAACKKK